MIADRLNLDGIKKRTIKLLPFFININRVVYYSCLNPYPFVNPPVDKRLGVNGHK